MTHEVHEQKRNSFEGVKRVIQFNWPLYAGAAAVCAILGVIRFCFYSQLDDALRLILNGVSSIVAAETVLSLLASYWIYDASPLHELQWLKASLPEPLNVILSVHSGYDEVSVALARCFPTATISNVDLYPSLGQREPSIERARRLYAPPSKAVSTAIDNWPIADSSVDLLLIAFAAHELRDREKRVKLLTQARKTVSLSAGRIVLVEHLRNLANCAVYGPGAFHFYSKKEWLECASQANLRVVTQFTITPFVGIFVLCP